ncbi:MAG: decarboxylase, partial [Nanoarchaeota archaeon]
MTEAKFILSKKIAKEQVEKLTNLGLKVSYSYKTNREVGNILQDVCPKVDFSIHAKKEIEMISDKSKIWFFTQAESEKELKELLDKKIRNFVIDNEVDLERILNVIEREKIKINLSLRMKFQEHRIGTGRYFVYGMSCLKVNDLILDLSENKFIEKLGIHIHRKSQNASEWEIKGELEDSLSEEVLERIDFLNFGGGLPVEYISYTSKILNYIFRKIKEASDWLEEKNIEVYIEPGRFIAGPCVKLVTEIIQIYENKIVLNTTIYNCALDTVIGQHKMLVESELGKDEDGEFF